MSIQNAEPTAHGSGQSDIKAREQKILAWMRKGARVSRNINELHEEQLTFGQKVADGLADVAGSWSFIITFLALIVVWVLVNSFLLMAHPWDPYPFILLNLVLSLLAGLQAPVIMMSQNRQEARDRIRAEHDYEVNLKAEMEIEQLHAKLDLLREKQWNELVELQQRQIEMLERQVVLLQALQARPNE